MKLFNRQDQDNLHEAKIKCETRILTLAEHMLSKSINENQAFDLGDDLMSEVYRLEKLTIVEAISDQDFNQVQKNFRSLLRPVDSLVSSLKGTMLASQLDSLRTTGIELLNDLYDDVKNVEQGINSPVLSKETSKSRDLFAKTFAEFAILIKGAMSLADLFGDDPSSLGGYTKMKEIASSLSNDDLLNVPLKDAFVAHDSSVKDANMEFGKTSNDDHDEWFDQGDNIDWVTDTTGGTIPAGRADGSAYPSYRKKKKPGFFSRLFGRKTEDAGPSRAGTNVEKSTPRVPLRKQVDYKPSILEKSFRSLVQKTIVEKSPGFAKLVNVHELVEDLMGKSFNELSNVFARFNNLVSNDVDVDFLKSVITKPLSVSGALKSVWDTFSGGSMGGPLGRRR